MKKATNPLLLIILTVISLISCTERIEIELDESSVRLVVEGSLTTDTMTHRVFLSRTSGYYYNQPPQSVSGAEVTISDGFNIYYLSEVGPGVYQTEPAFHGIEGRTYTLNIQLDTQIGGYTQYSASSMLNKVAVLDSINLLFHPDWSEEGMWEVLCYVQDPSTVDFYRFMITKNDTMVTDTLDEWFVTDDRFFNGYYVNGAAVAYLDQGFKDERLAPGDMILVELNNIGEDYANFLWDAQAEIRGSYPLFSGPPANVKGNINNGAIGFFSAYASSRACAYVPEFRAD